jgi:hypothetical protein
MVFIGNKLLLMQKNLITMTIKSFRIYLMAVFILMLPISSCGSKYKAVKAQKQQEKRLVQRKKEGERALLKGKQRHNAVQSKDTKKRMKETRRKSNSLGSNRKSPFYKRWYDSVRNK